MSRYIDANKLIERLMHNPDFLTAPKHSKDGIIDEIVYQPTADVVEVRHGGWKDRYEHKHANQYYECSVCGGKALDENYVPIIGAPYCNQELSPYCPHCGAKMDGERRTE